MRATKRLQKLLKESGADIEFWYESRTELYYVAFFIPDKVSKEISDPSLEDLIKTMTHLARGVKS